MSYSTIISDLYEILDAFPQIEETLQYGLSIQGKKTLYGEKNYWYKKKYTHFRTWFRQWLTFANYPDPGVFTKRWENFLKTPVSEIKITKNRQFQVVVADLLFNTQLYNNVDTQTAKNVFRSWFIKFMDARGEWLKTHASARHMSTIMKQAKWNLKEFRVPKGGYKTFYDLFLRDFKRGRRPIADKKDNRVVISPAEGRLMWLYRNVQDRDSFTSKGDVINIRQILNNKKPYTEKFIGGDIMNVFLWYTDYHWFHAPVSGKIVDISEYSGVYNYNFEKENWFSTTAKHKRTAIIYKTKHLGYVAMIPIGFWEVASIVLTVKKGDRVIKGDRVGHFGYGGSAIILLFEKGRFQSNFPYTGPMEPTQAAPDPVPSMSKWKKIKINEKIGMATR